MASIVAGVLVSVEKASVVAGRQISGFLRVKDLNAEQINTVPLFPLTYFAILYFAKHYLIYTVFDRCTVTSASERLTLPVDCAAVLLWLVDHDRCSCVLPNPGEDEPRLPHMRRLLDPGLLHVSELVC